jgi:hypothetical protein
MAVDEVCDAILARYETRKWLADHCALQVCSVAAIRHAGTASERQWRFEAQLDSSQIHFSPASEPLLLGDEIICDAITRLPLSVSSTEDHYFLGQLIYRSASFSPGQ